MGYLCRAIPVESLATMQGILHGVYWGLGSGAGYVLGGILVEQFGARITFGSFAVTAMVMFVFFIITQKVCIFAFNSVFFQSYFQSD